MASGWFNLGLSQLHLGKFDEAAGALGRAARMLPESAQAWLWLSQAYRQLGQEGPANEAYEKGRALDPEMAMGFAPQPRETAVPGAPAAREAPAAP
jgi:tetratricopeptide (TPR) repeat protein